MDDLFSILVYEKDKELSSILTEQITHNKSYKLILINDKEFFLKTIKENKFHLCIANLDELGKNIQCFVDTFYNENNHKNIIFSYIKKDNYFLMKNKSDFTFIIKPFKFNLLIKHIEIILNNNHAKNIQIFLMKNLVFTPNKKMLMNIDTNKKEHLTEKETYLLEYLFRNQNIEILKKKILNSIWGINEDINTHTLETHVYRLRQKLNKLEPKLGFVLNNINGKYLYKKID